MTSTLDRIPAHLRQHVVEQDYSAYDEVDQAVWRFVLLQLYDHLKDTAHPAYTDGLAQTGISVERIPRIEEMDACLSEYGWGAVVVDGFIPPKAFQEFQALGIMTIAAAIRRRRHIAYTPAPDIIHESAGHAPIVPNEKYRRFLQRFGEIGARTFASPEDRAVYEAVRALSDIKEDRDSTPEMIDRAQENLDRAIAGIRYSSEAARLTRLHWWTVEYGLVGSLDDYRIYGAGLLSSLGESHSCQDDEEVKKIPLSIDCTDVDYDITRQQPQLFVAEDFDHLDAVLDEFAETLAQRTPGKESLEIMRSAAELGTVELDSGMQIIGILDEVLEADGEPCYLGMRGPCALAREDRILKGQGVEQHPEGYGTPIGRLADGTALGECRPDDLERYRGNGGRHELLFASGVRVEGRLRSQMVDDSGRLSVLSFADCRVRRGDELYFEPEWGVFDMVVGESVRRCFAGPADPDYHPATEFPGRKVPRAKDPTTAAEEGKVLELYRRALKIWEGSQNGDLVGGFQEIEDELQKHPDEWLLRWNLAECLRKRNEGDELVERLRRELLDIEKTDPKTLPITTGLRYLDLV